MQLESYVVFRLNVLHAYAVVFRTAVRSYCHVAYCTEREKVLPLVLKENNQCNHSASLSD